MGVTALDPADGVRDPAHRSGSPAERVPVGLAVGDPNVAEARGPHEPGELRATESSLDLRPEAVERVVPHRSERGVAVEAQGDRVRETTRAETGSERCAAREGPVDGHGEEVGDRAGGRAREMTDGPAHAIDDREQGAV